VESARVAACQREPRLIALGAIVGGEQGFAVAVVDREGMRLAAASQLSTSTVPRAVR
jgi:hypothetical protein